MNALQNPLTLVGRIMLAVLFLPAGLSKIGGFAGTAGYIASKGLPLPEVGAAIAIAVEVLGGLWDICTDSVYRGRCITLGPGRHVLTEKPMATKWDEGMQMVRVCREAGVKLFVVKQNRLNATMQLLKKAVDGGRFGRIFMVVVNVFWTRPQSYYDDAPWRGRWDMDGGAFLNQASHYVDMVDWLVGPVDSVHAYTATLARDIEAEDTGVMSLRLRRGGLASINVTMLTHGKNFEGSVTILGERGTVRVGGVAVNRIEHWEFDQAQAGDDEVRNASYQTASVYGFGHPLYYANVIDTLRGEAHAQVDGYEGLRSLEVVIAAYRSARDGVRVGLPLVF